MKAGLHWGYLLYLFVLADDFLAGDRVLLDTVVPGVDDQFAERTEPTVAADSEQWSVEERMILTEVVLTLRPVNQQCQRRTDDSHGGRPHAETCQSTASKNVAVSS